MPAQDLSASLDRLGLSEYRQQLFQEAFDSWDTLTEITNHDLNALGIKRGHRQILKRAIAQYKNETTPPIARADTRTSIRRKIKTSVAEKIAPASTPMIEGDQRVLSLGKSRASQVSPEAKRRKERVGSVKQLACDDHGTSLETAHLSRYSSVKHFAVHGSGRHLDRMLPRCTKILSPHPTIDKRKEPRFVPAKSRRNAIIAKAPQATDPATMEFHKNDQWISPTVGHPMAASMHVAYGCSDAVIQKPIDSLPGTSLQPVAKSNEHGCVCLSNHTNFLELHSQLMPSLSTPMHTPYRGITKQKSYTTSSHGRTDLRQSHQRKRLLSTIKLPALAEVLPMQQDLLRR